MIAPTRSNNKAVPNRSKNSCRAIALPENHGDGGHGAIAGPFERIAMRLGRLTKTELGATAKRAGAGDARLIYGRRQERAGEASTLVIGICRAQPSPKFFACQIAAKRSRPGAEPRATARVFSVARTLSARPDSNRVLECRTDD